MGVRLGADSDAHAFELGCFRSACAAAPDDLLSVAGDRMKLVREQRVGDSAGDAVGSGLDGIVREMGVTGGGLDLGVPEQLADHRQPLTDQ